MKFLHYKISCSWCNLSLNNMKICLRAINISSFRIEIILSVGKFNFLFKMPKYILFRVMSLYYDKLLTKSISSIRIIHLTSFYKNT